MNCEGPIIACLVGSPEAALSMSRALLDAGLHATAIRPPTVPEGTSRIRLTLSAAHAMSDIDALTAAVIRLQN